MMLPKFIWSAVLRTKRSEIINSIALRAKTEDRREHSAVGGAHGLGGPHAFCSP